MLVAALASGSAACGGLTSIQLYRPLGPIPAPDQPRIGEQGDLGWTLEREAFRLFVPTVELSEELTWVFGPFIAFPTFWEDPVPREGPLRIGLSVTCLEESHISFDPGTIAIAFGDGSSLKAIGIAYAIDGERESMPLVPVVLTGGEAWHGFLEFDAALVDLAPFTLTLPTLTVNGVGVDLPPIPFERGTTRGSA